MEKIFYFLPAIILLGIVTSYDDIKYGKIKNKYVVFGILYGIIAHLFLIIIYKDTPGLEYFLGIVLNVALILIIGFLAWLGGLWSAGDAKLLFAYSTLIPLETYQHSEFLLVPSIILAVNSFIPAMLFYSTTILIKSSKKSKIRAFRNSVKLKSVVEFLMIIISFGWIIRMLLNLLGIKSQVTYIILLLMSFYLVKKFISNWLLLALGAVIIARIAIDPNTISFGFVFQMLIATIAWFIVINPLIIISQDSETTREKSCAKNAEKSLNEKLKKSNEIPFAPILFAGVLLTLILKGSVVFFLINLIK